jgi:hypothetical protein
VTEYVVRFLAGGLLVSMFAVVGDIVRPKSFAGLFEAAPSVATCSCLRTGALTATLVALPVWFVVAFGLYGAIGR